MRAAILSLPGADFEAGDAQLMRELDPWGVILMGRSVVSAMQVRRLVDELWQALGRSCMVFIDQEGGRVARLKTPEWPVFPAAARYGEMYARDPETALEACRLGHRLMAFELSPMGVHADCSPCLDLPQPGAHDIIGDRAFAADPQAIIALGRAALNGLASGGVAGVIKHIPGHGRALADSHERLPVVEADLDALQDDFACFAGLAHAPMAMTAHIAYPAIDGDTPATLSSKLISETIRSAIGFDGLLMSDDLGMKALGGSLAARAESALAAGCDVVLHCAGFKTDRDEIRAEMREVGGAASELAGAALERAKRAEAAAVDQEDRDFDPDAAWARFKALTGGEALS